MLSLPQSFITKILFATAVPFAEIAVNLAFVTVTTRVLFAQAFDRLLPVSVAKIGDKNHALELEEKGYDWVKEQLAAA